LKTKLTELEAKHLYQAAEEEELRKQRDELVLAMKSRRDDVRDTVLKSRVDV
jgi:hypothetical protein